MEEVVALCALVSLWMRGKRRKLALSRFYLHLFLFFSEVAMMNMLCERQPTTACDFFLYDFL